MLSLRQKTYILTSQIPKGKVLTYKELAYLASIPSPRLVGLYLHQNPYPNISCYRVVNASGKVAQTYAFGGGNIQKERLEKDGIIFTRHKIDLEKYLWRPKLNEIKKLQKLLNQNFLKFIYEQSKRSEQNAKGSSTQKNS